MTFRKRGFRAMVVGLVVTAGLALAPAAFARDHFGIGIALPGLSIGVGNGGWGRRGYVDVGVGGYYSPAYYESAPVYYDTYPAYYGAAVYGGPVVYSGGYYGGYYGGHGYYRRGGGHYGGGHYYGGHDGYRGGHDYNGGGGYYHH